MAVDAATHTDGQQTPEVTGLGVAAEDAQGAASREK